jgi:hypothetical protein
LLHSETSHLDDDNDGDNDKQHTAAQQEEENGNAKATCSWPSSGNETVLRFLAERKASIRIENTNFKSSSSSSVVEEAPTTTTKTAAAAAAAPLEAVVVFKQQDEQEVDAHPKEQDCKEKVEYSSPTQPPPPPQSAAYVASSTPVVTSTAPVPPRNTLRFSVSGLFSGWGVTNAVDEMTSNDDPLEEAADKKESACYASQNDSRDSSEKQIATRFSMFASRSSDPPESRRISASTSFSSETTGSSSVAFLSRHNRIRRWHSVGTGAMLEKVRTTPIEKEDAHSKRLASLECKNASLRSTLVALRNMHQSFPTMTFERQEYAAILAAAGRKHGCTDLNDDDNELGTIKALETALIQQMHHTIATQKQLDMIKEQQRDVKKYLVRCKAWLQDSHVINDHWNDLQAQQYAMSAVYRNTVKQQEAAIEKYSHLL